MILTVCMSPSVDVTIELDQLNVGKVNIVKSKTLSFTGKAINVAIGIARLGGEAYATGFMYNENGAMFERALDKEGVPFAFVWNRRPAYGKTTSASTRSPCSPRSTTWAGRSLPNENSPNSCT